MEKVPQTFGTHVRQLHEVRSQLHSSGVPSEAKPLTSVPSLEEIQSLEEALHRPDVRRSREALKTLLAEGFVEFGASGSIYDRRNIIDLHVQESGADDGNFRSSNYVLMPISNDAVILTYETEHSNQDGSKRRVLRSSVWKHDGLKWQMVFHQGTVRS
ncbi:nuclear transport factor 2 family protein [Hoeflea alexandrii]|uniref:DUF4440 domain-containing protein n=1 Tax=Hoeflea alexandrii TaxID=288436 RepID=A0ABT1CR48_9HYPH|nr:DUF4440 domain-containing protein [Hoeflea alexandrii]MCO6408675.1 DUF4440 domain-containing protein [Hoeflea alexandrii]MCY0151350.1 DUF4440 domain-containing protein [Hoeflea alexandrii]